MKLTNDMFGAANVPQQVIDEYFNYLIFLLSEVDMNIIELLNKIKNNDNFEVKPACGYPEIKREHVLPNDLKAFFGMCGGIKCYIEEGGFPIEILSPNQVMHANELLLGNEYRDDISSSWYVIANAEDGNYITIDCSRNRLGRCYESFQYSHGSKGFCPIIALSFTELLNNIFQYNGDYFFWKDNPEFSSYGDAYDVL